MPSNSVAHRTLPWVEGTIAGLAAWALGYGFTYLIAAPDVRDSPLQRVVEVLSGDPATYEIVGWVFYNAHFVGTVFQNVPLIGGRTTTFIGGDEGLSILLYVVPVGVLLVAGVALARYHGATSGNDGVRLGLMALPGYLLLSIAGVFFFEVTVAEASGAPDLLPAVLLAGIIYPAIFAGGGGAVVGIATDESSHSPDRPS